MEKVALIVLALSLSACAKDPVSTNSTDNPDVPVSVLFETDGCKVYRFSDAGRFVYFTNCSGSTTAYHTEYCGKGCVRHVAVQVNTENEKK